MRQKFDSIARFVTDRAGSPAATGLAFGLIVVWVLTGPLFHFSDTWQLVINTGTTIITFLMVFLIQAAQNRDTLAINIKLDEVIRSIENASDDIMGIEKEPKNQLDKVREQIDSEVEDIARSEGRIDADTNT